MRAFEQSTQQMHHVYLGVAMGNRSCRGTLGRPATHGIQLRDKNLQVRHGAMMVVPEKPAGSWERLRKALLKASQFQLALKLHLRKIEKLRDGDPSDARIEFDAPVVFADLCRERKYIDNHRSVIARQNLNARRSHLLFPVTL